MLQPHLAGTPSISAKFFESAVGTVVNGGTFITHGETSTRDDGYRLSEGYLDRLYPLVAQNAILNQGGRADEVRCYPGTREEVISKIEAWRDGGYRLDRFIFWLSGPAGAGKSAIVQTVAERCIQDGLPMINFFFFRADTTRNHARPLIPTLVFQLFKIFPSLKGHIATILRENPLIFDTSLATQWRTLITEPILRLQRGSPSPHPIVLLIDGLDECVLKRDQHIFLQLLHELINLPDSPFIVLVASRTESQIIMTFNSLKTFHGSVFLDDSYRPEEDIRLYVRAELAQLRRTHPLSDTLGPEWPSDDDINSIVSKSSGQFIYAATVVRFVSNPSKSPHASIQTVLGIRPAGRSTPFAEIDALYTYILSQVDDWALLRDLICLDKIFMDSHAQMIEVLQYDIQDIRSSLMDVAPLLRLTQSDESLNYLHVYHASFHDFLFDKIRGGAFYTSLEAVATCMIQKLIAGICNMHEVPSIPNMRLLSLLCELMRVIPSEPTVELTSALQQITPAKGSVRLYRDDNDERHGLEILTFIENKYRIRDEGTCAGLIHSWMVWLETIGFPVALLSKWDWARPASAEPAKTRHATPPSSESLIYPALEARESVNASALASHGSGSMMDSPVLYAPLAITPTAHQHPLTPSPAPVSTSTVTASTGKRGLRFWKNKK